MNIALLEVFYKGTYVTYYTPRLELDEKKERLTETEKFYEKFDKEEHSHFIEFDTIVRVIDAMGEYEGGAEEYFFRPEDKANALPPRAGQTKRILKLDEVIKHTELRLYCIRLTNEVVILLNGDIKTEDQALNCPNVKGHFRFAQRIATLIDDLLEEGLIEIKGKEILNNTGEAEIILYI